MLKAIFAQCGTIDHPLKHIATDSENQTQQEVHVI